MKTAEQKLEAIKELIDSEHKPTWDGPCLETLIRKIVAPKREFIIRWTEGEDSTMIRWNSDEDHIITDLKTVLKVENLSRFEVFAK